MDEKLYYLKENVILEPLYNRWYAWSYLISPGTAPSYITKAHLPIMASFVENPAMHAMALRNPQLAGGPFIDYGEDRVNDIRGLMEQTKEKQREMLQFSQDVDALNEMLLFEASGYTLETLYNKVPERLKGYVELVYDLNNQPAIRFIEPLLYHSPYYNESAQSIKVKELTGDYRPFLLSTPHLDEAGQVHLHIPFRHPVIDTLARMKEKPAPLAEVFAQLGLDDHAKEAMRGFFTTEQPELPADRNYTGDGVRIRYFGHACVLVESSEVSILTDPFISYRYPCEGERFTFADLPDKIDYVLITHNHQDHVLLEVLLQLRHKIRCIVVPRNSKGNPADPSLKLALQHIGFDQVRDVDELESIGIPSGEIVNLPFFGEHGDLDIRTKGAHLVRLRGRSILLAADSSNLEVMLYKRLAGILGKIDTIFIGMESEGAPISWLYGPLLPKSLNRGMDQSRRLNGSDNERALRLALEFNPERVYVYALGMEPWTTYILAAHYTEDAKAIEDSNKMIAECRSRGIEAERFSMKKEVLLSKQS